MIDFSGANLTRADCRGVDLTGMVNFSGAKLHDVNFAGSTTDKGLIDFSGADIRNAKGLPALHESNEYLEGLKSFSESIKQQFKTYNIPAEQIKPIEESVRQLVEEVEGIRKPEEIDEIKKKNINLKLVEMVGRVIKALPIKKEAETLRVFTPLAPFVKIIGEEVPQIVESIQKNIYRTATRYLFVTKWGSIGNADGQFDRPFGVAVDSSGNVYVADDNNRIQKFNSSGTFITKWGSEGTADGQFDSPYGVAVDSSGNVYVADIDNKRIQVFSPSSFMHE
jgi:hypothetical protein